MNIEDLSPEIRAAGAALLKAWQGRSSEEQSSFAQTLAESAGMKAMPAATPAGGSDGHVAHALAQAERIAAVSGGLNPAALVKDASMQAGSIVLDQLAPSFDRAWKSQAWSWTLKSERRAAVLKDIPSSELAGVLAAASGVVTDTAGIVLRTLLSPAARPAVPAPLGDKLLAHEWAVTVKPKLKCGAEGWSYRVTPGPVSEEAAKAWVGELLAQLEKEGTKAKDKQESLAVK